MNTDLGPVGDVAEALASDIEGVLHDDLVGLYVYGSAVSGGFDPGVSDLDLVAVTAREVEALDLPSLERMQHAFVGRYPEWSNRLEIVYIGRATLQSFRTSSGSLAVVSPGETFHVRRDRPADWLQNWYLVRETGASLRGVEAASIIPPIAWPEFAAGTIRYADELGKRSRLAASGGTFAYTILTMCRALRTVRTQTLGSKQESAAWVRQLMPHWDWVIDEALLCRMARGKMGFDEERMRAAADAFIGLLGDELHRKTPGRK